MKLWTLQQRIRAADTRPFRAPDKQRESYYGTAEHKQWAQAVIRRAAYQCQDAAHNPAMPRHARRLFADHIIERSDNGAALDVSNGRALCGACHTRKTLAARAARLRKA